MRLLDEPFVLRFPADDTGTDDIGARDCDDCDALPSHRKEHTQYACRLAEPLALWQGCLIHAHAVDIGIDIFREQHMLTEEYVEAAATTRIRHHPFAAIIFDWDGTAVASRHDDATGLARLAESLLNQNVWLVVVTGTNFGNIDRQFCSLVSPTVRRHLIVCANRGSEVFGFDDSGAVEVRYQRRATPEEDAALSAIAEEVRDAIHATTGLDIGIVYDRLNRRKIDLIPLPEWADPPKSRIGELLAAVDHRLSSAGFSGGVGEAVALAMRSAREHGLQVRITSDVKHVEVGLTDKGDSVTWIKQNLLQAEGIALTDTLILGDEFGPIGRFPGSDDRLRDGMDGAAVVSVGAEPDGVPPGVLHVGGGPGWFRALLLDQVCAQYEAAHPSAGNMSARGGADSAGAVQSALTPLADPLWRLDIDGYNASLEHSVESRCVTANGALGVRGALPQPTRASNPAMFVAGLFDTTDADTTWNKASRTPPLPALVPLSDPTHFHLLVEGKDLGLEQGAIQSLHRWLDMRRGVFGMEWHHSDPDGRAVRMQLARFTSLQQRALHAQIARIASAQPAAMSVTASSDRAPANLNVVLRTPCKTLWQTSHSALRLEEAHASSLDVANVTSRKQIRDVADSGQCWSWQARPGQPATLTQLVAMARVPSDGDADGPASCMVKQARDQGVARLLAAHERAWADRWAVSDIEIEGDDEMQRALRFALYHLITAANPEDEHVSIGARGLTGEAYFGHVFWDTEIFMLPFYTFTWPAAARALLMYRYHTLPAARAKSKRLGYRGALFAWESANSGEEVTPPYVEMPDGRVEPIRCGTAEQHISADVAYAVWQYWQATGDKRFLLDAGAEIMIETARFWASRAALEADGRYHIRQVIGPDEYHTEVDDNAFTNEMARWNIERGLEVASLLDAKWPDRWAELCQRLSITPGELSEWRRVAVRLAVHIDPTTGVIEQFNGFATLESVDLSSLLGHNVPVDVLLGPEQTARSQVLKQADVVMLLALLQDRYTTAQQAANFRYYESRCAHGSSLSPSVHALVAARLGETGLADRYLHQSAAIDLDDTMGNAALGMHLGALGGLWQAIALGLTGLRLCSDGLHFDPHVPEPWRTLRIPLQWHGRLLRVTIQQAPLRFSATLERGRPLTIHLACLRSRLRRGETWRCRWNESTQGWEEEAI